MLDSGSHGLRAVRNPFIRGTLQQCRKKLLVESDNHNRTGPSPDWRSRRSRTGQLLKVVANFNLVSPGLDLLVAHSTSAEKMLTQGSIVYETQSRSLPRNRNTRQPDITTDPDNNRTLRRAANARGLLPTVDLLWPTGGEPTRTSIHNTTAHVFAFQTARKLEERIPLLAFQWRHHGLSRHSTEERSQESTGRTAQDASHFSNRGFLSASQ